MRLWLALLCLASWATAEIDDRPVAPEPTPEATHRYQLEGAIEGYLTEAQIGTPDGPFYLAPASGGLFGWIYGRADYWYPKLKGDFLENSTGTTFSASELNVDENEPAIMAEVALTASVIGIRFDFFHVEFSGDAALTADITFGGVTFTINEMVDTDLLIDNYRLLGTIRVLNLDAFNLVILAGVSYYHLEGTIESQTTGLRATEQQDVPVPVIGLLARGKVGILFVEAEATGFGLDYGDVDASFFDVRASVGLVLFKVVTVRAGYRYIVLDLSFQDFDLDMTVDGFFLGAGFAF